MSKCKDVLSFSCNRNGRPDLCYVVKLIHHDLWREPPNDRFFQTKPETSCRHGRTALQGGRFLPRLGAHADQVWVTGDFNDWSKTEHPLVHEGNGYWYAEVKGAKAGQEYKFVLRNGDTVLERIDPVCPSGDRTGRSRR